MYLKKLLKIFSDRACNKVYIKVLAANDNSKNQVYLGGSFDVLNILPIQDIVADEEVKAGSKVARFKSKIDFSWVNENGDVNSAPGSNLILYPDYPEVRFSGFLKGAKDAPSELMVQRLPGRLLFLGVSSTRKVIAYVTGPDSELANEVSDLRNLEEAGVFKVLTVVDNRIETDSRRILLDQLRRIYGLGWINSRRLDSNGNSLPCVSSHCGGYTLEAELGVKPNGYAEPDYLGWELKQFAVRNFEKFGTAPVTLMTPEPTHGFYVDNGVEEFIRTYGYKDKLGREARLNFGGIHKFGIAHATTKLTLVLSGYNDRTAKIENAEGFLGLIDNAGNVAASWSFASLLKHWNTKHANACYVPSQKRKIEDDIYNQQYRYGHTVMLGRNTDFSLFLNEVVSGDIVYDPGIKLELEIPEKRKQNIKRRSQFRIKANNLTKLYRQNEVVNLASNI